ncbi:ImmA/IrrE family metallo-endopeptidase [Rhizobium sp. LjRoot30]|uniref:ImmA/IrrE family metallo-endopeptidase n=1 Tax=Rhizobium sp. LjRoot30 TaxID=3342320 RepID=UPI003ECCE5AB
MAVLRKSVSAPRDPREYDPKIAATDARKIAQHNLLTTIPMDVRGLANALGLRVASMPMDENVSGYLEKEGSGWTIGVNSLHHINRQRFTIAHEIGHYFLHRDRTIFRDGLLFRQAGDIASHEREANLFASLLLMPDVEFRQALTQNNIPVVAEKFGVSQQAANFRVKTLGEGAVYG